MIWNNMREILPPMGHTVLVGIQDNYYLGEVDSFNVLHVFNGRNDEKGIPLSDIWWTPILPVPKKPK